MWVLSRVNRFARTKRSVLSFVSQEWKPTSSKWPQMFSSWFKVWSIFFFSKLSCETKTTHMFLAAPSCQTETLRRHVRCFKHILSVEMLSRQQSSCVCSECLGWRAGTQKHLHYDALLPPTGPTRSLRTLWRAVCEIFKALRFQDPSAAFQPRSAVQTLRGKI